MTWSTQYETHFGSATTSKRSRRRACTESSCRPRSALSEWIFLFRRTLWVELKANFPWASTGAPLTSRAVLRCSIRSPSCSPRAGLSPAGYRPVLYTTPHPVRPRRKYSPAELQRRQLILTGAGELADLYDRAQAQRGDGRRAVRL